VEVREADGRIVNPVQVGCFQNRIPVAGEIAVALVVTENENDVGRLGGAGDDRAGQNREHESRQQEFFHGTAGFDC
jgi:hypothetical protein